jgi:hypothetical protein
VCPENSVSLGNADDVEHHSEEVQSSKQGEL